MKSEISKTGYQTAQVKMNVLLDIATDKGGFDFLSAKEKKNLATYTQTVKEYEDKHYSIFKAKTIQKLIKSQMSERGLMQKEMAELLNSSEKKLSDIMCHKRKPNLALIKAMHEKLGIDGNLLLRVV